MVGGGGGGGGGGEEAGSSLTSSWEKLDVLPDGTTSFVRETSSAA